MATEFNEFRPRTWGDYVMPSCSYKISYIKNRIAQGDWGGVGAIVIDGPNGSGKTTLAHLIARSTLCLNRQEGSWDNCGECKTCLGKAHPNIIDETIKEAAGARELFKQILDRTRTAPLARDKRSDRNRYFVILNEFQVVSREAASFLLDHLENPLPHVTWVLVSMEPERLSEQVRGAIEGRCRHITLNKPTQENIIEALTKHPLINWGLAEAIVGYTGDNYRKAWSELSIFLKDDPLVKPDVIHKAMAKGASPKARADLYLLVKEGSHKKAIALRSQWAIDDEGLYDLIVKDMVEGEKINLPVMQQLSLWKGSKVRYELMNVLLGYLGEEIVIAPIKRPSIKELIKTRTFGELIGLAS
jgi:DNA polymerase III delta prime subunit